MSLHVFANIVTPFGTAANNRGETEGNTTTLQKLIWHGETHSTVSAEAIRFALRRRLYEGSEKNGNGEPKDLHRWWDESERVNRWNDYDTKKKSVGYTDWQQYADDDLLGFMSAEAAQEEGEKGTAAVRRAVLEMTRAISLTPWPGDVVFNAASPGATPTAAKKERSNPVPYGAEVHSTRYQYGLAMTPEKLCDPTRAVRALTALGALGTVAGNHSRFLFDFSPESIILRLTDDPAPRFLYCFTTEDDGKTVTITEELRHRIGKGGSDADLRPDIRGDELIIGGVFAASPVAKELEKLGVKLFPYQVMAAVREACSVIHNHTQSSEG